MPNLIFYPTDHFYFFSVYYPDVPMLAQPKEIKMDEELKSLSRSSLANIGSDIKESPYDSVPNYPDREAKTDAMTEKLDVGVLELEKNTTQIDGDSTPKVSRVSNHNLFPDEIRVYTTARVAEHIIQ